MRNDNTEPKNNEQYLSHRERKLRKEHHIQHQAEEDKAYFLPVHHGHIIEKCSERYKQESG